jgi:hypothetical protein
LNSFLRSLLFFFFLFSFFFFLFYEGQIHAYKLKLMSRIETLKRS